MCSLLEFGVDVTLQIGGLYSRELINIGHKALALQLVTSKEIK